MTLTRAVQHRACRSRAGFVPCRTYVRWCDEINLNAAQQQAVDFPGPGPWLVIAGAGTGKTSTIAHRVARLVRDGADPARMLLITFSRRAATELESRVGRVIAQELGGRGPSTPVALPWAGTFHAAGAQLLRLYAERIGLSPQFTIHDRGDSEDLMGLARAGLAVDTWSGAFIERRVRGHLLPRRERASAARRRASRRVPALGPVAG